jgi:predicted AAA+ superfamily ATPase
LDRPEEIEGAALETLVLQELMALNALLRLEYTIHYWRTATGLEVDFVLYGKNGILAIEVKRTAKIDPSVLRGLKAFIDEYPMARGILLYGGDRVFHIDGIEIIPIVDAMTNMTTLFNNG